MSVSIIIPVYNASKWLNECFDSILSQKFGGCIEVSIFSDGSTDDSFYICQKWIPTFASKGYNVILNCHRDKPKGVGFAKNKAVEQSHGEFLCFLDADDVMDKHRIQKQWEAANEHQSAIIGSKFHRYPPDSTVRFTKWANNLTPHQFYTQVYTSNGPTLIMPTWFCHRSVFINVGGFNEEGKGIPEDLIFYFKHLDKNGKLFRVDEDLLMYRFHPDATTFSIAENTIWTLRLLQLEKNVLNFWASFTVWNAGKQGRRFYRTLSEKTRSKIIAFCDVDEKKIKKGIYTYEESLSLPKPTVPIIHYTQAKPPFIICIKMDLTRGEFERNLASLHLQEGVE